MCYKCRYCGELFQDRAMTVCHQDYCEKNPQSRKKMQDLFGTIWGVGEEDNTFYHVTDIDEETYKLYCDRIMVETDKSGEYIITIMKVLISPMILTAYYNHVDRSAYESVIQKAKTVLDHL